MSAAIPSPVDSEALAPTVPAEAGRRRRRRLLAMIVLLVAVAAVVLIVTDPFGGGSSGGVRDNASPTSLATVQRRPLTALSEVSGTLGYTGDVTVDLSAGSAPATVTLARQAVTADQGMLASARSTLSADSAALSQARATLAADQQQEGIECTGDNAAQGAAAGGGSSSGGSGACAADAQLVASGQQSVGADVARVAADQVSVSSAERALTADGATLASASAQATVYGPSSAFTSVPSVGKIVRRGQSLFAIDGEPTLLLYGSTTATREFAAGMSPGPDVAELNANLDALGYGHGLAGNAFTPATASAVRRLQAAHGEYATGQLLVGSVVFAPGTIRVTSLPSTIAVGAAVAAGPVLSATGTAPEVQIQLDPALQGQVRAGDPVTITLPNYRTTPGRITQVSPVATPGQNGGPATIAVDAVPTDPAAIGNLDQAPVNVSITTGRVANAFVVPVDALLALEGGGYAVEEVATNGVHHLVAVTTGLFDDADGLVQVSGPGLAAGQRVVVPGV
jgi:peptidoglycan hydrolase-like protein with peptidoglycan-binding domain